VQLNLGLGTYGRSFRLKNPSQRGIGAPAEGVAPNGWIEEAGFYGYNDICYNNGSVWTTEWDDVQKVRLNRNCSLVFISYEGSLISR